MAKRTASQMPASSSSSRLISSKKNNKPKSAPKKANVKTTVPRESIRMLKKKLEAGNKKIENCQKQLEVVNGLHEKAINKNQELAYELAFERLKSDDLVNKVNDLQAQLNNVNYTPQFVIPFPPYNPQHAPVFFYP